MLNLIPEEIEAYCLKHMSPESALARELFEETHRVTDYPQMLVGPLEGAFLQLLIRLSQAKRVLEIGTFTGYSALMMAEALPEDGRITTCDINPDSTKIARRFWSRSPHAGKIELKLGKALDTLTSLSGPFDFVFIDADKENYVNYWEACLPKVRQGGLIVVDNVLWGGKVLHPKDPTDHAIVQFNHHTARDTRVQTLMLPIRDGITVATKK